MNRIAYQYAIVRFTPFIETGEFANVGVVMMAASEQYFDFKLKTKRYGRVTQFFEDLDSSFYSATLNDLQSELNRIQEVLKNHKSEHRDGGSVKPLPQQLFNELTRPRESIIRFSDPGVVLTDNPAEKLKDLFGYYVERNFVTQQYRETVLEQRMRKWLNQWQVRERFNRQQIGDDVYHATFPFVEQRDQKPIRIIKPLHLGQNTASKILDHSGQWVFRINQLRLRNHLPKNVLFAVDGPDEVNKDDKREVAYRQSWDMLLKQDVKVLSYKDREALEAFALGH